LACLRAPTRTAGSGRSNGTEGWHEEAVWQLAGARGAAARGADVGRARHKDRLALREGWKAGAGQSIRPMAGCAFSTSRRTLGGHVAARKWENAARRSPARPRSAAPCWPRRGEPGGGTSEVG